MADETRGDSGGGGTGGTGETGGTRRRGKAAPPRGAFVVELGDANNRTISIMTLKIRLRGRYSASNMRRRDVGAMLQMPDIPGIHMGIDMGKRTVEIADPLREMPQLCAEITRHFESANIATGKVGPATKSCVVYDLSDHELKTLVREIAYKCERKPGPDARLRKGRLPEADEIEALPGRFLSDPWNSSNERPKFEDEVQAFIERLQESGVI